MTAKSPLAGKRVVVTGGAGFLGSHVVDTLRARGVRDVVVPRSRDYDLVDGGAVERLFRDARPEVIIHLAAVVGGIGANRAQPGRFFYENLMMGTQVIEAARHHATGKVVLIGTVCSYPRDAPVPFREDDLWNGYPEATNAPYGIAKKALLVQAQAYRAQYGLNAIFLLPVNLYGPRDNFDPASSHVIPALIARFLEARDAGAPSVVCWGDGTSTREFLHVAEAAEGIVLATERYDGPLPVNLGSGEERSIAALATLIAEVCGYRGQITWDRSKPNGQPRRRLDTSRAEALFGFKAGRSFRDGVRETVQWFEEQRRAAGSR